LQPNKVYIDCTLGGGGHTRAVLERGGKVIGIDQDSDAIAHTSQELRKYLNSRQLDIIQTNFRHIADAVTKSFLWNTNSNGVDGVLMDLGVSSFQIDENIRGFSFGREGALDMRMNKEAAGDAFSAWHIVNDWGTDELADIIYQYGEERKSRQIAREIVLARPLQTTLELAKVIERITPRDARIQTLARCFQALRIAVNDEMGALDTALERMHSIIKPGGRLVVLSYHSLEDRRAKLTFRRRHPVTNEKLWEAVEKDIVTPTEEEIAKNSRSRSAKLRVARRL
jgi:16S rRNA (cytosine1402-N4)-methyltransferase